MTFQIGLRGAGDSWLIASDRRAMPENAPNGVAVGEPADKIEIDPEKGVAFAGAGSSEVLKIGRAIVKQFNSKWLTEPNVLSTELERIATEERHLRRPNNPERWDMPHALMIGVRGALVPLWNVRITPDICKAIRCERDQWLIGGGDRFNAALFFIRRYFERDLSVEQLTMLAAHVVLTAGKINPEGVGGLEMVISKGEVFTQLRDGDAEFYNLEQRSRDLDHLIAQRLGVAQAA